MLIVASTKDQASMNIANKLIENYDFKETNKVYHGRSVYEYDGVTLIQINIDAIHAIGLDTDFHPESIIFISRHSSESGQKSLTVHAPGNTSSSALYGGSPKQLAWVDPGRMKSALINLKEKSNEMKLDSYMISLEATHHGPTVMKVPTMFIEIGSSREQWNDKKAAEVAASAALLAATRPSDGKYSVGFGGGHYSSKHTEIDMTQDFAIGHILPKYFFNEFIPEMISLSFARTIGNCRTAIIDWKGLRGTYRSTLIEILEKINVDIVRI